MLDYKIQINEPESIRQESEYNKSKGTPKGNILHDQLLSDWLDGSRQTRDIEYLISKVSEGINLELYEKEYICRFIFDTELKFKTYKKDWIIEGIRIPNLEIINQDITKEEELCKI